MLGTIGGNGLTVHQEGNGCLAGDGSRCTDLAQLRILFIQNVLDPQSQLVICDGTGLGIGSCHVAIDPHGVAIAFHQGIDHFVSIEKCLVAQSGSAGNQADALDTGIEAVGGIFAIFFNDQVILGFVADQLLHSTMDGTAQRAALFCLIFIVGRVDQLQLHTFRHSHIGGVKAVQIQHRIGHDFQTVFVFRQLDVVYSFRCLYTNGQTHGHNQS